MKTLDEELESIIGTVHHWDAPESCWGECEKRAITAIKSLFVERMPEGKPENSKEVLFASFYSGFNDCRNQILKELEGEK